MILEKKYREELRKKSRRDIEQLSREWLVQTIADLLDTADSLEWEVQIMDGRGNDENSL